MYTLIQYVEIAHIYRMKKVWVLCLCAGLLAGCASEQNELPTWLEGDWRQANEGSSIGETWRATENGLEGVGYFISGTDSNLTESFTIQQKGGKLFYTALVPGNEGPIDFPVTKCTETELICELPEYDFPKQFSYKLAHKDSLLVDISGSQHGIEKAMKLTLIRQGKQH